MDTLPLFTNSSKLKINRKKAKIQEVTGGSKKRCASRKLLHKTDTGESVFVFVMTSITF